MSFSTLLTFVALLRLSIAGYVLEDDYSPSNFFSMFDFFTDSDPTNGFVSYVNHDTASSDQLISTTTDSVYIGVDHTNVQSSGRPSVRLTSSKSYNEGLIILDLDHMPGGACGTWPAFWMVGPNWPSSGEIDIIEGVNEQSTNAMTLHTGPDCAISNTGSFSGAIATSDCYVQAADQSANAGCSIGSASSTSYGSGFNAASGGVYATVWTSDYISVYFFPRGSVPSDISSGSPDPYSWGMPQANFSGSCDITSSFKNLQIVFDTTFCGDWAGAVWSTGSCASKASTCEDYVANNPSAFADAYWSINSLKVYQESSTAGYSVVPSSSAPVSSVAPSETVAPTSIASTSEGIIPGLPSSLPVSSSSRHHSHGGRPSSFGFPGQQQTAASVQAEQAVATASEVLTLSSTTNLGAESTAAPFPAGNFTRPSFATGTGAPFPAGNDTRPPFPTGTGAPFPAGNDTRPPFPTGSGAPFPFFNGSHHHHHGHRPTGVTGFVTVTVTDMLTVEPSPVDTAAAAAIKVADVTEAFSVSSGVEPTPTLLRVAEFPSSGSPGGITHPASKSNSDKRRHKRHMAGLRRHHHHGGIA